MKLDYTLEEIAKFNTISICVLRDAFYDVPWTSSQMQIYYSAILKDLQTGAMEKSCKTFEKYINPNKN